jgi:hypothetical protein
VHAISKRAYSASNGLSYTARAEHRPLELV